MEVYQLETKQVFENLGTSENGLAEDEAKNRIEKYGLNEIKEVKGRPLFLKFIENFYHLFAILLWVGGILSFVANQAPLGWAIFAVIIINAIFSFWQEFKAEKATEELKKLLPQHANVIRGGERKEILAAELVPGDLIVLDEGDYISADSRVIENFELRTNDSALTGESHPARKNSAVVLEDISRAEAPNMVFAGTTVVSGNGRAVVTQTGMNTEFGKIAALTQGVETELSPLQKQMKMVTKIIGMFAVSLGIVFYFIGSALPPDARFVFAIGIIVANVPEGLLPTVTLSLALGVQRMVKRNALIKKLSSVETLGSTNIIATDKTGTLTQNEMTVKELWANDQNIEVAGTGYEPKGDFFFNGEKLKESKLKNFEMLFKSAVLVNNAKLVAPKGKEKPNWTILGDPTEAALLVASVKGGIDLDKAYVESFMAHQIPFESERKRMSTVYRSPNGEHVAYIKGAPKELLELSSTILINGKEQKLDGKTRDKILKENDKYAKKALRVLAMAYKQTGKNKKDFSVETVENEMVFVGLMAMMDPPREEVKEAVDKAHTAGIKIIMITGDYGLTAEAIARKIGIVSKESRIITGSEFEKMKDEKMLKLMQEKDIIFARVAPEHKMRVVTILKDAGNIVAVTGDGVNDAPALKKADIGVAMGIAGTDVAREAADMILTDDNFASIVNAIEEGRAVFDNIRRFVTYILASNIPQIIPFILFSIYKIPLPLTVMQILAIDLGTDLVPALALGTEAPAPGVMQRAPRPKKERLLNWKVLARAYGFLGPIEAAAGFGAFYFMFYQNGYVTLSQLQEFMKQPFKVWSTSIVYLKATTMSLAAIVTTQIGNGYAVRTIRESIFKVGFFSNKFFLWGIASEIAFIFVFVYTPVFQKLFGLAPIGVMDWVLLFVLWPLPLIGDEIRKLFVRKFTVIKA